MVFLFIHYLITRYDDLSLRFNCSGIGGYLGTSFIIHFCYADDLCHSSLSLSGMQNLRIICEEYAATPTLFYSSSSSSSNSSLLSIRLALPLAVLVI